MRIRAIESIPETTYSAYPEQQQEELFLVDAFLRALGWSNRDAVSIEPIDSDPPDVLLHISGTSLGIEVTRWIPWDQGNLVRRDRIVESLQERLKRRCTKARTAVNFFVVAHEGAGEDEIERAADAVVAFLGAHDVGSAGQIMEVYGETFKVVYVPAQGSFRWQEGFESNIRIADITGHDITDRWRRLLRLIEQKKLKHNDRTDVLLISGPPITGEESRRVQAVVEEVGLPHSGVYYLCVVGDQHSNTRAGLDVIRRHPLLKL